MLTIEQAAREHSGNLTITHETLKNVTKEDFERSFRAGVEFANRWIPVEEDLPELGEKGYSKNVLICDDPQDEEDARIGYRITDIGTGVTHWNNNEHPAYWRPIKFE